MQIAHEVELRGVDDGGIGRADGLAELQRVIDEPFGIGEPTRQGREPSLLDGHCPPKARLSQFVGELSRPLEPCLGELTIVRLDRGDDAIHCGIHGQHWIAERVRQRGLLIGERKSLGPELGVTDGEAAADQDLGERGAVAEPAGDRHRLVAHGRASLSIGPEAELDGEVRQQAGPGR